MLGLKTASCKDSNGVSVFNIGCKIDISEGSDKSNRFHSLREASDSYANSWTGRSTLSSD